MIAADAVVTFERPEGFVVVKSLGTAHGEAVAPRDRLRATFRTIGSFMGLGPIDYLTDAERARRASLAALVHHAERIGANGVVGLQFDASELVDGSTRVLAFGEAVLLEREPGTEAH